MACDRTRSRAGCVIIGPGTTFPALSPCGVAAGSAIGSCGSHEPCDQAHAQLGAPSESLGDMPISDLEGRNVMLCYYSISRSILLKLVGGTDGDCHNIR